MPGRNEWNDTTNDHLREDPYILRLRTPSAAALSVPCKMLHLAPSPRRFGSTQLPMCLHNQVIASLLSSIVPPAPLPPAP